MAFLFTEAEYEDAILELYQELGYDTVHGPDVERDYKDPLYKDVLYSSLEDINKALPDIAVQEAIRKIENIENGSVVYRNKVFMDYLQNGVPVRYFEKGEERSVIVKLIDYDEPKNNYYCVANQWTIEEGKDNKRPDVIVFVNGLPLVLIELKSPTRDVVGWRDAYNQIRNYIDKIEVLEVTSSNANENSSEINRLTDILKTSNFAIEEYDDLIVRRTIECIRVMSNKTIIIIFKGGFEMTESLEDIT